MKHNLVEIQWIDSETNSGWESVDKIEPPTSTVLSLGFLIYEDSDFLILVADFDEAEDMCNRAIAIPKVCVRHRRTLAYE